MPACTLHLLSLTVPLTQFLSTLTKSDLTPLTVAKVIRWIILPTSISIDPLLAQNIHWDILLVLPSASPLPSTLQNQIQHQWSITAGIPSRLLENFSSKNEQLLHPKTNDVPPLTGSLDKPRISNTSQSLELSPSLQAWISTFSQTPPGHGAVSMFNLLAFHPQLKSQYLQYGAAFASSIGAKRGGNAKLVGTVISEGQERGEWDEIALAHYPSILHFADMLASEDYQEVNQKYRVGSLRDTFILCTSELDLPAWGGGSKL